jgi:hypothetical protein
LITTAHFVQIVELQPGLGVGCLGDIAFRRGYVAAKQLLALASAH